MALEFKLETFRRRGPAGDGIFIHLKLDPPCYRSLIAKENYSAAQSEECEFITNLFAVPGVVALSVQAYRVYLEKSDLFSWDDIIPNAIGVLMVVFSQTSYFELPGSRLHLTDPDSRRSLD